MLEYTRGGRWRPACFFELAHRPVRDRILRPGGVSRGNYVRKRPLCVTVSLPYHYRIITVVLPYRNRKITVNDRILPYYRVITVELPYYYRTITV